MSVMDRVLPKEVMTPPEEDLMIEVFSNVVVQKYLRILAAASWTELLTVGVLEETPESLTRKHTLVAGKLAVITTLLSLPEYKT